jgi:hypothetical protein
LLSMITGTVMVGSWLVMFTVETSNKIRSMPVFPEVHSFSVVGRLLVAMIASPKRAQTVQALVFVGAVVHSGCMRTEPLRAGPPTASTRRTRTIATAACFPPTPRTSTSPLSALEPMTLTVSSVMPSAVVDPRCARWFVVSAVRVSRPRVSAKLPATHPEKSTDSCPPRSSLTSRHYRDRRIYGEQRRGGSDLDAHAGS